jgi:two-component system sensor histidine kinase/response regulator
MAPEYPLEVRSDRRALSQILINLTNNAIKFTDEGSVRVEVSRQSENGASAIRFSVIDTGRWIKPSDQQNLFAAFEQIQASSPSGPEGTGLGLYISQRLTALIGGVITFESEFGKGSTFTLELRG